MLNLNLYEPAESYEIPTPYYEYKREGKITALFSEYYSRNQIPIEIIIKYTARAHSATKGNPNYYDSVKFSNIEVESVQEKN